MATETKTRDHEAENQTWDYSAGHPYREQITVYVMKEIFSAKPVARPVMFNITFYAGRSMNVTKRRRGFTHRLISIFAHLDGPDPHELIEHGSSRWGTQVLTKESLRRALKAAIVGKFRIPESQIQYLDRVIATVI